VGGQWHRWWVGCGGGDDNDNTTHMVGADGSGGAEVGDGGSDNNAEGELSRRQQQELHAHGGRHRRSNSMSARGHARAPTACLRRALCWSKCSDTSRNRIGEMMCEEQMCGQKQASDFGETVYAVVGEGSKPVGRSTSPTRSVRRPDLGWTPAVDHYRIF